ncbi:hypothetical protein MASR1M12_42030 [Erysipelotrichia bacterium]
MMDVKGIWKEVKENQKKLRSCKRHCFGVVGPCRLGQKITCQNCGGVMGLSEIGDYIRGYEAAGGAATDIVSDWQSEAKA